MVLSGPNMCNICCNHENRSVFFKSPLLKKWHYLDLVSSVHVVTITTGLRYSNRSRLKLWHFLDLVCSVPIVTMTIVVSYSNRSRLKKWHFLGLICAIYVATMRIEVYLSNLLSSKSGIFGPIIFSTCSNHYNWVKL